MKVRFQGFPVSRPLTTRRSFIAAVGAAGIALALPRGAAAAGRDTTGQLARYMVAARDRALPAATMEDARHRILDTVCAMVSGARLEPGRMAIRFIRSQGGSEQASVLTTDFRTTAINAALANGMLAHSDESDDVELVTKTHPGSSTVAAALAMAELMKSSGEEFVRAVALGYDVCCRFLLALGPDLVRQTHRGAEGYGATMGAMAAAASLARFDEMRMRYAMSFAAQQVSGLWSWVNDPDHIEKAFDFSGMGARNGVTAALMVASGMTGVHDILDSSHNLLEALSIDAKPAALLAELGQRFYISETSIKTYPAGYPNQAPLDAFLRLYRANQLHAAMIDSITVRLPSDAVGIVSGSSMPDVNCQYLIATAAIDGQVSFESSHSREAMKSDRVRALMTRIEVVADPALDDAAAPRAGRVDVHLVDGRALSDTTRFPPGTKENPITTAQISAKAQDLMAPVLGPTRTQAAIKGWLEVERVADMRELVRLVVNT